MGGSGGCCPGRTVIVGWLELLPEAGTERAIVDGAADLQQQFGAASRPAYLRIASPEMLPIGGPLSHLICSRLVFIGGGVNGADQHGDA